jgi:hypothetical protein
MDPFHLSPLAQVAIIVAFGVIAYALVHGLWRR